MEREFDNIVENIFDRLKAKAAGAVGGAKAAAGALGQATWLVLKKVPDWRWFLEQTHTPWYPNMKLYRQQHFNDWKPVFKRIENDIIEQLTMKT